MSKRLWNVTVEVPMVVLAEDKGAAEEEARESFRDEIHASSVHDYRVFSLPISTASEVLQPWDMECVPWGEADDRTIAQILAAGMEG